MLEKEQEAAKKLSLDRAKIHVQQLCQAEAMMRNREKHHDNLIEARKEQERKDVLRGIELMIQEAAPTLSGSLPESRISFTDESLKKKAKQKLQPKKHHVTDEEINSIYLLQGLVQSQKEIAKKIKLSASVVSRVLSGKRRKKSEEHRGRRRVLTDEMIYATARLMFLKCRCTFKGCMCFHCEAFRSEGVGENRVQQPSRKMWFSSE